MDKHLLSLCFCLAVSPLAHAASSGSDVCTLRPDLCDNSTTVSTPKSQGCRPANTAPTSRAQAALPICAQSRSLGQTRRGANQDDDLLDEPYAAVTKSSRAPASTPKKIAAFTPIKGITFDEYLKHNASSPYLSSKIADHQNAFVDRQVVVESSTPSDGISTAVDSGTTTAVTPAGNIAVPISGGGGGAGGGGASGSSSDGFSSPPGS